MPASTAAETAEATNLRREKVPVVDTGVLRGVLLSNLVLMGLLVFILIGQELPKPVEA